MKRREYRAAIRLLRKEIEIRENHKAQDPEQYYRCKLMLADAYDYVSEYKYVLYTIENDINEYKNMFGSNSDEAATALNLLGLANYFERRFNKAIGCIRDAIRIAEINDTKNTIKSSLLYYRLAMSLMMTREIDEAEIWFTRTIATRKPLLSETILRTDTVTANSHLSLAGIHLRKNQLDKAEVNAGKAIEIHSNLWDGNLVMIARSVIVMSMIYESQHDFLRARNILVDYLQLNYKSKEPSKSFDIKLSERLVTVLKNSIRVNKKQSKGDKRDLLSDVKALAFLSHEPGKRMRIFLEHRKYYTFEGDVEEIGVTLEYDYTVAKFFCDLGKEDLAWEYLEIQYDNLCKTKGPNHPITKTYKKMITKLKKDLTSKNQDDDDEDMPW